MRYLATITVAAMMSLSAAAQCSDADKKALREFDLSWSKAGQSGDKTALIAVYADDYTGLPGMQSKTAAIDTTMRTFERNKANPGGADKVTYDHYIISCTPNTATVTHRNTVWTPNGAGGKPETFYTRSVHVLEKRGGKWQVVSNAGSGLDDYDVLWYMEQDWNDAILKKDKAWFDKNYASDFTSISSTSGQIMNRAEAIADDTDPNVTMELAETTGMDIRMEGNTAVVTGTFRVKGKDAKGAAFDRKTRYTDTWIRRDGRWQAWSSQGTPIPEEPRLAKN
ncbi:MAG TPA: nuclear transport factor 2 family protein [Pyrinomonadaceae bacterium]|nr:nuclear transport factor 2 family protein [Pyrinomonadaceae bacterium]